MDNLTNDAAQTARGILAKLLSLVGLEGTVSEPVVEPEQISFTIDTPDVGRVIGHCSQTLDAIQFLLNRLLSRQFDDAPYCVVDAGNYRAERHEKLVAEAMNALENVRATGRPYRLPLLNAMDRRVVHQALKPYPEVSTLSDPPDRDGRKRIVVSPVSTASVHDLIDTLDEPAPPAEPAPENTL